MFEILNRCVEVEETVAEIYRQLAAGTADNPELKRIWAKMAIDEDSHADTIRFALRMNPLEHLRRAEVGEAEVVGLLEKARYILDRVRSQEWSEAHALKLACELENQFKRVHIQMAAEFNDGPMKNLFRNLGKGDEDHVAELESYLMSR